MIKTRVSDGGCLIVSRTTSLNKTTDVKPVPHRDTGFFVCKYLLDLLKIIQFLVNIEIETFRNY